MVAGRSDGSGDGVLVEGDEQELTYEYAHPSVSVDLVELKDSTTTTPTPRSSRRRSDSLPTGSPALPRPMPAPWFGRATR
jgi:hypothetical protein